MNYIDRYVKLKPEDFQLSLWGGAAVLNKLDLRLDAIEAALNLPIKLSSGHISELKIQVCTFLLYPNNASVLSSDQIGRLWQSTIRWLKACESGIAEYLAC